jgi:hypothetical protein
MGDPNPMSPEAGSQFLKIGSEFGMHNSAPGKAVLAELPSEAVERILDLRGLPATTEETLTTREGLREELEAISERGYATNDEELQSGFRSVGAPVRHSDGTVLGALSIGGPAYRFEVEPPAASGNVTTPLNATERVEEELARSPRSAKDFRAWAFSSTSASATARHVHTLWFRSITAAVAVRAGRVLLSECDCRSRFSGPLRP